MKRTKRSLDQLRRRFGCSQSASAFQALLQGLHALKQMAEMEQQPKEVINVSLVATGEITLAAVVAV